MGYRLTREALENDALFETICALSSVLETIGQPLYIVGASARDIAMKVLKLDASSRRTQDLDVAIMLENWADFDDLAQRLELNRFKRYRNTQKFYYKGMDGNLDYEIDVVPFGNIAENEMIKWPPDGNPELSVRCFTDIMGQAIDIHIEDSAIVKIAPIAGQFLIKLDTWNDRHLKTDKDAADMFVILDRYYDYTLEYYPEKFAETDLDIVGDNASIYDVQAYLLAVDATRLLSEKNLRFYVDLIAGELSREEESDLIYHFMKLIPADEERKYDIVFNMWKVIYSVFNKALNEMTDENQQ